MCVYICTFFYREAIHWNHDIVKIPVHLLTLLTASLQGETLKKIQSQALLRSSHLASGWIWLVQSVRGCFGYNLFDLLHVLYVVYWWDRIGIIESISGLKQTLHTTEPRPRNST